MSLPIITALTAALLLILQQILMITVGAHRGGVKVGAGSGGDTSLERKIRRHGNLAENAPIFLLALALLELSDASSAVVGTLAAAFVAARLLHVLAFASEAGSHLADGSFIFPAMRSVGAISTALIGIGTGTYLLVRVYPLLGGA